MTEAIEVLQNEIGKIKSHIREMKRMSDVVQCDLVKDWPTKVTELEIAVERLLKIEGADNFTKSNNERDVIALLKEVSEWCKPGPIFQTEFNDLLNRINAVLAQQH